MKKSGFVSLIGRPNAGKSSLMNSILNYEVAITSSTPQTTRNQIRGIYNDNDSQIIFIDTPGIHKPKEEFGEHLNKFAYEASQDVDLNIFLTPIDEKLGPGDKFIIDKLNLKNSIALITKLDLGDEEQAKAKAIELKKLGFKDVLGVSTKMKDSVKHLLDFIKSNLTSEQLFYDEDSLTDISIRFMAQEFIRETIIENTKDEIPHSVAVKIDNFEEKENEILVESTIYVNHNSQKGILIGKNGSMIKKLGISSREKMENSFGEKVILKLQVKEKKNWTKNPQFLKELGY